MSSEQLIVLKESVTKREAEKFSVPDKRKYRPARAKESKVSVRKHSSLSLSE